MEKLSKEIVALSWFFRGLEDLFFAFKIYSPFRYEPFFNAMGFEMICKSYLLAEKSSEYENLDKKRGSTKIDKLAKNWRHDIEKMVAEIKVSINDRKFDNLLNQSFDGYTGNQFIDVMKAA